MMTKKDLTQLAQELIKDKLARGESVAMEWAVQEIVMGRGQIIGSGVAFYELCAREYVYEVVKREVGRYGESDTESVEDQMIFAGYDHLRIAYTVLRDDERVLVPIADLSDEELKARAAEFLTQADGLKAHAKEIEKYLEQR